MLNNYFTSTTAGNCINPRKNSEFLIEGNYIAEGVKHYYGESSSKAVTWKSDNYIAEGSIPDSKGSTVTVPYTYTVAPYSIVPETVKQYAGATLFTETPSEIQSLDNMTPSSIDPNTPIYNLAGQRVDKNYKGIVIKNGKKIFIK